MNTGGSVRLPGELFLQKVAIRHPGASRGRPRAQKNTAPPLAPPENNTLAAQVTCSYESTQNKFPECPAGRQQTAAPRPHACDIRTSRALLPLANLPRLASGVGPITLRPELPAGTARPGWRRLGRPKLRRWRCPPASSRIGRPTRPHRRPVMVFPTPETWHTAGGG